MTGDNLSAADYAELHGTQSCDDAETWWDYWPEIAVLVVCAVAPTVLLRIFA
jgi:hypothetical protein